MEYAEYAALYPDGPEEGVFERLRWQARRIMEQFTTGVDGVCKLRIAPPMDGYGAEAVSLCEAALIRKLWQGEQVESYVNREDETVTGRVVTGMTAGAESVTFAAPAAGGTGREERAALLRQTVSEYLGGVCDGNGVNLLYMGKYPVEVDGDV